MRTFTTEHTVYSFDELSADAQQKALANLSDINVDESYWYFDEALEEIAKEYGIALKWNDLCFELDRNNWLYLDNHGHSGSGDTSYMLDSKVFLKKAGLDLRSREAKELLHNISLDCKHYGGGDGRSIIDTSYADNISGETEEKLQACIDELCDKLKRELRDEYDGLTSEEVVKETIYANEYEFTAEGMLA